MELTTQPHDTERQSSANNENLEFDLKVTSASSLQSPRRKYHPYMRAPSSPSKLPAPLCYNKVNGRIDEFPVRILPYLFLGNASNSEDRSTLDKCVY